MDISKLRKTLPDFLKKYRYVILVLLIGLGLMAIPSKSTTKETKATQNEASKPVQVAVDEKIEQTLSQIQGAGKVEVLLTVATGEETVYQTNEDASVSGETNHVKKDTVTVTDAQRNQTGLVRQVNPPHYLGAIVVCQGADSPTVQLAIVDAVSKVTGLGADRISVLKMK